MNILVTGFEPFGQHDINPSEQVVHRLAADGVRGVTVATAVLPVDTVRGPEALLTAINQHQPDSIVCLGEAGRRPAISVERIAINLLDFSMPDNSGQSITDTPIIPNGPDAYFTTLPVRAIQAALAAANIPVQLSLTAGTYLCNQVTYVLLHHLAQHQLSIPAGFIHLPYLPQQAMGKRPFPPTMSLDLMVAGISLALETIAAQPGP